MKLEHVNPQRVGVGSRTILVEWSYALIHHDLPWLLSEVACLEVVCRFEQRTFYIGSLRVKLILPKQPTPYENLKISVFKNFLQQQSLTNTTNTALVVTVA